MYWTEWGRNPSVVRMSIEGNPVPDPEVTTILTSSNTMSLSKPNGLYLDLEAEELFVGDAEKQKIIKCKVKSKCETYINDNHILPLERFKDNGNNIYMKQQS